MSTVRAADVLFTHSVGRGAPLVLVHGLGEDHRGWRRALPALMLERTVILCDIRGHGATELGDHAGTLAQFGDDLARTLVALDLGPAAVLGFSMGGLIGARCAIDHPGTIAALATVSTSPVVGAGAAAWYVERARLGLARDESLRAILEQDAGGLFRMESDRVEGIRIRLEATADLYGFGNACAALAGLHQAPIVSDLGRVTAPSLIVVGEQDRHTPVEMHQTLLDAIPDARRHSVRQAGYAVPVEAGPQLALAVLGWLEALELG